MLGARRACGHDAAVSAPAFVPAPPAPPHARTAALLACALAGAYALLYAWLSYRRFASFHAQIDLSYYLRLCWGLSHGRYDLPLVQAPHVLGLHLEPILLPLVLLHRLGVPLPPLLLGVQAVAVALLAWPAYRLGQRRLGAPGGGAAGALCALGALLYPTVTVATLHDFHPVTLALAPLLGVLDALDERRLGRALGLGLLALACREDIALQLLCVLGAAALPGGALAPLVRTGRGRVVLGALALALAAYFFGYVVVVQPQHLPRSGSYGLHFGGLVQAVAGDETVRSGRALLAAMLRHPLRLALFLLTPDRLLYPLLLVGAAGGLPLLSPRLLAGALPVLGINLLSSFPRVRALESHYTTALVPFVLAAAIVGAARAVAFLAARAAAGTRPGVLAGLSRRQCAVAVAALALGAVTLAHVCHGGSPLALRSARFQTALFRDEPDATLTRAAIRTVTPAQTVAARPGPLAHLAERPRAISPPEYDDGRPVDVDLTALLRRLQGLPP